MRVICGTPHCPRRMECPACELYYCQRRFMGHRCDNADEVELGVPHGDPARIDGSRFAPGDGRQVCTEIGCDDTACLQCEM